MKTIIMVLISLVMATGPLYGQTPDPPPPIPAEEQPEVLTRGPVNEAFAQPVSMEEDDGFIAPEAPPADIEEVPPEEEPVGEQFAWIPGYWAWDSDRDEYIWISGCWRAVPPGKYWVPGYWTEVEDGWRWVAGFWAPVGNEEIEYLPAPPAVAYIEPVTTVPDKIWVSPCWYWSHGRYTLRSGYWIAAREDWVWVPSHYVWTPRGYVFVTGHWDYPFHRRGVLFAPLHFPGHTYRRVGFSCSLSIVIDIGNLEFSLFTRPKYRHYYFGDYYDSFYIGIGIFPWFECVTRHTWYDPIYLHDRWRHRKDKPHWRQHERLEYARRRADKKLRPPRTYRELERKINKVTKSRRKSFEVAAPMKKFVEKKITKIKFRKRKLEDRKQVSRHVWERNKSKSSVTVRKTDRPVKKNVSATVQNVSIVKKSLQSKSEAAAKMKRSSEIKTITPNFQKHKPKAQSQVSRRADHAPKNTGARSQRKSLEAVPDANRTEMKVVSQVELKRPDLKTRAKRESSRPEHTRLSEVKERDRKGSMISHTQVKPLNVSRREQKQDKPSSVKVKSSPVVHKKKSRSSPKKQSPRTVEEQEEQKKIKRGIKLP
ncbi:hypothetical protein ACFL1N_04110 [Thermodesulfobacteriota bacterium]